MKKIYILPNLFTTANMFCGFYCIIAAIRGEYLNASWAILGAMIFDSMDGRIARLTRATSAFGVEYDSLSDLLSFGVAPSILAFQWCLQPFNRLGWLAAFLYVVCAALRLARFNVLVHQIPKSYFQGIPSPLAACTLATAVIFYTEMELKVPKEGYMLGLILVLASLMISTIRFPSFKEMKVSKENSFGLLAVVVLTLVLIAIKPEVTLFVMCIAYIVVGALLDLRRAIFRKKEGRTAITQI
jgi:CDP-diacylglycerol--serine O-phosphatidyltransferase